MIVLLIYGVSGGHHKEELSELKSGLKNTIGRLLKLDIKEISVLLTDSFFPPSGKDGEIICLAGGFFEDPKRTANLRQELAGAINQYLAQFAREAATGHAHRPQYRKVEVRVGPFNQIVEGSATCDPLSIPPSK